jgi:hypothetical protein
MRIFDDMKAYMGDVTSLIWNFIQHRDAYPKNAQLAVQPEVMANVIDDPAECQHCDFYDLNKLISCDSSGQPMPNHAAIHQIACRYYQVG